MIIERMNLESALWTRLRQSSEERSLALNIVSITRSPYLYSICMESVRRLQSARKTYRCFFCSYSELVWYSGTT